MHNQKAAHDKEQINHQVQLINKHTFILIDKPDKIYLEMKNSNA
jgi:phage-related protein